MVSEIDSVIGVDTEFFFRSSFFRIPCLMQFSTGRSIYVVDLRSPLNLARLESVLLNPSIRKVMHGIGEDIKLMNYMLGIVPNNVVDTQLAGSFLSDDTQISYESMVNQYLDVTLDQSSSVSTSDWTKRPLTAKQLRYAKEDVRFLVPLWNHLHGKLESLGRTRWFFEEMQHVLQSPEKTPREGFESIRGVSRMGSHDRGLVYAVAEWRETFARRRNLPRSWIARDDDLLEAVGTQRKPSRDVTAKSGTKSGERLKRSVLNAKRFLKEFGSELVELQGGDSRLSKQVKGRLRDIVVEKSQECGIARGLLGSQSRLLAWSKHYLQEQEFPANFGQWRDNLIGAEVRNVLNGLL